MTFANEMYSTIIPTLIAFIAKVKPFQPFMFRDDVVNSVQATDWWKSQSKLLSNAKDVLEAATQLLTAVASSAEVERVFSSLGLVQSKLHNRLGTDKAAKLAFIFIKLMKSKNGCESTELEESDLSD